MTFRLALSSLVAFGWITGCAFSQWTEHYYFGDYLNKPVYQNRIATGIAIMPFAMVADLVSFPVQGVLLIIKGDGFLYRKSSAVAQEYITQRETLPADAWAGFSDSDRERVKLHAQSELERLGASSATGTFAFAIGEGGKLDPVQLSSEQWEQLRRRIRPELVENGAALDQSCSASL